MRIKSIILCLVVAIYIAVIVCLGFLMKISNRIDYVYEQAKHYRPTPEVSVIVLSSPDFEAQTQGSFDKINWFDYSKLYKSHAYVPFQRIIIKRVK